MDIKELLEKQAKLDKFILDKKQKNISKNELLVDTLLALSVEVSEFANATRAFKHWSDKGPDSKERLLDEYADILHFLASIANQLDFTAAEITNAYDIKYRENIRRQNEGY